MKKELAVLGSMTPLLTSLEKVRKGRNKVRQCRVFSQRLTSQNERN